MALYEKWTERILEEFFTQGDLEKSNNLPISPFFDRLNVKLFYREVLTVRRLFQTVSLDSLTIFVYHCMRPLTNLLILDVL